MLIQAQNCMPRKIFTDLVFGQMLLVFFNGLWFCKSQKYDYFTNHLIVIFQEVATEMFELAQKKPLRTSHWTNGAFLLVSSLTLVFVF